MPIPQPDRTPTAAAHPLRRPPPGALHGTLRKSAWPRCEPHPCLLPCSLLKTQLQGRELHSTSPTTTPLAFPRIRLPRAMRVP